MERRTFLLAIGGLAFCNEPAWADAIDMCGSLPTGIPGCRAGMTTAAALEVRANQKTEVWCWAASLEMIFKANGYSVPQERFVEAVYGRLVSLPAFAGYAMTAQLNRQWTDTQGKTFHVQIDGLYDYDAGIGRLTPADIVNALRTGRPLLLCNTHHAMVLGIVDYIPGPMPQIVAAGLIDPWPYQDMSQGGTHGLTDLRDLVPIQYGGQLRYLALPKFTAM